ncbi:MAG TPA: caspase family protein, partial [Herpetosiphonaceae bacterium]|nr:caspase family protein [Herpetosiphonaceae bacterium]
MDADPSPGLWALLIGINEYAAVPALAGSVNDVMALRSFLTSHLDTPDANIRVLTNQQATRAAILHEIDAFLIHNPAIQPGDQVLLHFSGHGSQMPDPTGAEPDQLWETLVAYDSRLPEIFDIPDKTLAALLAQMARARGAGITVVLDCCHSGSGTRAGAPALARTRHVPTDERPPPMDLDRAIRGRAALRGARPGRAAELPYVLLAACRSGQQAREHWVAETGAAGVWHGALTYFTLSSLRTAPPGLTYAMLHERVAAQISARYPQQLPQCEGDRQRAIFGRARGAEVPWLVVQRSDD